MQLDEFIEATSKLENYYGKELTTEQSKIMYESLKNLSIEKYRTLIIKCLKTCKYMPKIADIWNANTEISMQITQETRTIYTCDKCEGTGCVFYTKFKANGDTRIPYTYVARCICENAKYINEQIPTYTELGVQIGKRQEQMKDTSRSVEQIKTDLKTNFTF